MKERLKINVFQWINLFATAAMHWDLLRQINDVGNQSARMSILGITMLMALLYYTSYWFALPKLTKWITPERSLVLGTLWGSMLFKMNIEAGLAYIIMMMVSSLFTKNRKPLILLQIFTITFILVTPVYINLDQMALGFTTNSLRDQLIFLMNLLVFTSGFAYSNYYFRMNQELKEAQLKLEEFAVLKERQRMAQEIHDSLGHSLTSINMHLEYAVELGESDPAAVMPVIEKLRRITAHAIYDCRTAVSTFKEHKNDSAHEKNLSSQIEDLIKSMSIDSPFEVKGVVPNEVNGLEDYVQNLIFVSLREAITNAIKYSGSKVLYFAFKQSERYLELEIWDCGKGVEDLILGNGLSAIADRLNAIDGKARFFCDPQKGFCITLYIPLE